MKKTLARIVFSLLLMAPAFAALPTSYAHATTVNTVVKGTSSTLYWYASNGSRYVFPNANTYYSWFPDFSNVVTVNDSDLATMPLAGSVTYRPGAKLVKVESDPKVYAVSRYGVLRWVTSEWLATQLYGSNWSTKTEDLPAVFFSNYTVGAPIYSISDYNVGNEYTSVSTPNDNIQNLTQNNCTYSGCAAGLTASQTSINPGQGVTLYANFPSLATTGYIQIVQGWDSNVTYSCPSANTCSVTLYPQNLGSMSTIQYFARYLNSVGGSVVATAWSPVITVGSASNNGVTGITLTATPVTINSGDTVHFSANVSAPSGYNYSGSRIEVVDMRNSSIVRTCYYQSYCTQDVAVSRLNGESTVQFYAVLKNAAGTELVRGYSPTIYFNGNGTSGTLNMTASGTNINQGDTVTLSAQYTGTFPTNGHMTFVEVFVGPSQSVGATCYQQTCSLTISPSTGSHMYRVNLYDANNNVIAMANAPTVYVNSTTSNQTSAAAITGLTLVPSYTSIHSGDTIKLTANAYNSGNWSYTGNRIEIRDSRNGTIVRTCYDQSWCVTDLAVNRIGSESQVQYQAFIYDRNGNFAMSQYSPVIYFLDSTSGSTSQAGQVTSVTLTANNTSISSGDTVRLTANAWNTGNYVYSGNRIEIVDMRNGSIINTCYNQSWCAPDVIVSRTGSETNVQFYAVLKNSAGTEITRGYSPVIYFANTDRFDASTALSLAVTNRIINSGSETDTVAATLTNYHTGLSNITINLYDENNNQLLQNCVNTSVCMLSLTTPSGTTRHVYARAFNQYGQYVDSNHIALP